MQIRPVQALLRDLKSEEKAIREGAMGDLRKLWLNQKGSVGRQLLDRSQTMLRTGEYSQAEVLLNQLLQSMPDFAEAWHCRALLYFEEQRYRKAISDHQQALALNPFHFQAWYGLGLCHIRLKEYRAASQAFRQAIEIYPQDLESQRWLLECSAYL